MAGSVRSAFQSILRKSSTFRTPTISRLSTIAIQHKVPTIQTVLANNDRLKKMVLQAQQYGTIKCSKDHIMERVMKVCKSYDKLTACTKLTLDSHFIQDLGLDSLDHVEVIMAMEDEFGFEIPDSDAERLLRPKDIVQYVADKEDVYE